MEKWAFLKNVEDIRISDLTNFVELAQLRSVRELARRKNQTPSQVSRSLSSLEKALGKTLMSRSALGLSLTEDGHQLVAALGKIASFVDGVLSPSSAQTQLSIASISFLSARVVSPMFHRLQEFFSDVRIVDFPPDEMVSNGLRGAFNVALHFGVRDWPHSWESRKIGDISWTLCVRKGHPLTRIDQPSLDEILKYPFVYPVYSGRSGLVYGDDQFPVSIFKRIRGAATSTADAAAEVLATTDQISYLPTVTVLNDVRQGRLVTLDHDFVVTKPLYLTVRTDQITQKNFDRLDAEFSKFLKEISLRKKSATRGAEVFL